MKTVSVYVSLACSHAWYLWPLRHSDFTLVWVACICCSAVIVLTACCHAAVALTFMILQTWQLAHPIGAACITSYLSRAALHLFHATV